MSCLAWSLRTFLLSSVDVWQFGCNTAISVEYWCALKFPVVSSSAVFPEWQVKLWGVTLQWNRRVKKKHLKITHFCGDVVWSKLGMCQGQVVFWNREEHLWYWSSWLHYGNRLMRFIIPSLLCSHQMTHQKFLWGYWTFEWELLITV